VYHLLLLCFANQSVIMDRLGAIDDKVDTMTNPETGSIAALTSAVAAGRQVEQQAVTFLATLEQQVVDLTAELAAKGTTADNSPALDALTQSITDGAKQLSDAFANAGTTTTVPPVTTPSVPSAPSTGTTDNSTPSATGTGDAGGVAPTQDNGGAGSGVPVSAPPTDATGAVTSTPTDAPAPVTPPSSTDGTPAA
jgi:hypothetical protein